MSANYEAGRPEGQAAMTPNSKRAKNPHPPHSRQPHPTHTAHQKHSHSNQNHTMPAHQPTAAHHNAALHLEAHPSRRHAVNPSPWHSRRPLLRCGGSKHTSIQGAHLALNRPFTVSQTQQPLRAPHPQFPSPASSPRSRGQVPAIVSRRPSPPGVPSWHGPSPGRTRTRPHSTRRRRR